MWFGHDDRHLWTGACVALGAFLLALVVATSAWPRMHHPARGHRIVAGGGAPPLDGFTTPSGAYSLRKLRSAYAGPAVKLQRVDTTTQDIGFTATGDFDTATATAFCTTACAVQTWYDQSGNARHLVQATAASQPAFIFNCNGSLPCARSTGAVTQVVSAAVAVTPSAVAVSISSVGNMTSSGGGSSECWWFRQNAANNRQQAFGLNWFTSATGNIQMVPGPALNVWHSQQGVINGAASVFNVDGVEVTGTLTTITTSGAHQIGGNNIAGTTCSYAESIVWDGYALTPAERTALGTNQKNYWMPLPLDSFTTPAMAYSFRKLRSAYAGNAIRIRRASDNAEIDVGFLGCTSFTGCPINVAAATAHCAATTCFGRTWYAQAGTFDLVQATTTLQPTLIFNCIGTLPCWEFPTNAFTMVSAASLTPATGTMTLNVVANRTVGTTGGCAWLRANGPNNRIETNPAAGQWRLVGGTSGIIGAPNATDAAWHSFVGVMDGTAASYAAVDGTVFSGTSTGNTVAGAVTIIGSASANVCREAEAIAWDAYAMPQDSAVVLNNNQRSFWGF